MHTRPKMHVGRRRLDHRYLTSGLSNSYPLFSHWPVWRNEPIAEELIAIRPSLTQHAYKAWKRKLRWNGGTSQTECTGMGYGERRLHWDRIRKGGCTYFLSFSLCVCQKGVDFDALLAMGRKAHHVNCRLHYPSCNFWPLLVHNPWALAVCEIFWFMSCCLLFFIVFLRTPIGEKRK